MNEREEVLDLVDDDDRVIGSVTRGEVGDRHLTGYRVVHGFLKNAKGELWIPRRTSTKRTFPNALDYGVAGHVGAGESYEEALRRETSEELNIDLNATSWKYLGKRTPKEGAHCFQAVYEITAEEAPAYNPDDYSGAEWMNPEELVRRIRAGESVKTDFLETVEQFYL